MESDVKLNAVRYSIKWAAIFSIITLFGAALLIFCSCGGRSISSTQDLKNILSEEQVPSDPALSDEILCRAAEDYARKNGFNPPVCLYTNAEEKIKARPGGRMGVQNTSDGLAMVMLMVNTGTNPIVLMNKTLKKGELAIYKVVGGSATIEIPGIVLKPAQ